MLKWLRWVLVCGLAIAPVAVVLAQQSADAGSLAGHHVEKAKVGCAACHGSGDPSAVVPEETLAVVNRQCVTCHGDSGALAKAILPKLAHPDINPHDSHLVAVDCTVCHAGHASRSEAYCLKCHVFEMQMPGAARKTAKD